MSSTFGKILKISLFGESHNKGIGLVIDSLPSGIKIDEEAINKALNERKPIKDISTTRIEEDKVVFLSGVFNNYTTGSPLAFYIENKNIKSQDYNKNIIRPSHADLVLNEKYHSYQDYRGGGHSSGRITAPLMVLGVICKEALKKYDIEVASHILSVGNVIDRHFDFMNIKKDFDILNNKNLKILTSEAEEKMVNEINKTRLNLDSVGGVIETALINVKSGIGEPFFDSLESYISSLIFSLGGVKGIIFGDGEEMAHSYGSKMNDELSYQDDKIIYHSNHNGGINGGISNGNIIYFKTLIKPTPSIAKQQKSINIEEKSNIVLSINGRHDPCIASRISVIINALTYYALLDLMMIDKGRNL